jgi:ribose transport system permease protein
MTLMRYIQHLRWIWLLLLAMIAIADPALEIAVALAVSVASGLAWGVINGVLVGYGRINPLIVTLGTLGMALGFSLIISGGSDIREVPTQLQEIGTGDLPLGIPTLAAVAGAVSVIGGVALAMTRFGRYTYAIGSNPEAVRRAGISVERHLVKVYGVAGLLAGFAGFLFLARFGTTSLAGSATLNLNAITAVILGGTSLFGGIGTIAGTVVGALIPAVLQNGLVIAGFQPYWQQVTVGAVLIGAVYLDGLRRRRE